MKKGMILDLYREGQSIKRVMAINDTDVIILEDQKVICNIDFENEAEIVIEDIFKYTINVF